jgi:acetyl-CoA synthetase
VSGHRLGSAEIESSLVANGKVAEAAVIGIPHDVKGTAVFAYVIVKNNVALDEEDLVTELKLQVRDHIGAFARPDHILITPALPKTRSGKIMRRLLRKIASQEFDSLGDITTLADTGVVEDLIERVKKLYKL